MGNKARVLAWLILLMVLAVASISAKARKATPNKMPDKLVRVFFADLCSKGCSDVEIKRWKENFRWNLYDLNKDLVPEYFLYIDHADWCGAGSSCTFWVYQKTSTGYKLLVDDVRLRPLKTHTKGYRDLVSDFRMGALPSFPGYWEYDRTVYKYDGRKYRVALTKTVRKKG